MLNKLSYSLFILLSGLLTSACSNNKSYFDFDEKTDFSQLKTYQWDSQPSAEFAKANSLIDRRIVSAVDSSLKDRGLTLASPADIKISYSVSFEEKLSSSAVSAGIGMSVGKSNRGHISLSSGNRLRQTTEGTLVLEMVSTSSNSLIWRSTSVQRVNRASSTPQESESRIRNIVDEMLNNFPPGNPQTASKE